MLPDRFVQTFTGSILAALSFLGGIRPCAQAIDGSIVINEIHYHPTGGDTAWIELHSLSGVDIDVAGWQLTDDVNFLFPAGAKIPGHGYALIAANPGSASLNGLGAYGPWTGSLSFTGGKISLRNRDGREMDTINFSASGDWPVGPDGSGATLSRRNEESADPNPTNWTASAAIGGTPGNANFTLNGPGTTPADSTPGLRFNEIGAGGAGFQIELINTGANTLDLTGYTIRSSTGATNGLAGSLSGGGLLVLNATQLGFSPVSGEKLYVFKTGGSELRDARKVDTKLHGLSSQYPGRWLVPAAATYGASNQFAFNTAIVINEIMYDQRPLTQTPFAEDPEEWIELYNRSSAPVALDGWTFSEGVTYSFPSGTTIPASNYLVVAKDAATLQAKWPAVASKIVGNFSGSLKNGGERIQLSDVNGNPVNEVAYGKESPWPPAAHGGGSSLELRDPRADNSRPEAWAASDESARGSWQTYTFEMPATPAVPTDPVQWNEFIFGLLDEGSVMIDDISVIENPGGLNRQLIQNGNFTTNGAGWRFLGTHRRAQVVVDPFGSGNVLRLDATGPTEHMHNHCETTLKSAGAEVTIDSAKTYRVSFRARWLSGSPLLNTRLYFNSIAHTTSLPVAPGGGTPGVANSVKVTNLGPTFNDLAHSPAIPAANQSASVSVTASDPDGLGAVSLFYAVNGGTFSNLAMTATGGGRFTATIPGQAAAAKVQFYVQAADGLGALGYAPAGGTNSRAMIAWNDGQAGLATNGVQPNNIRIVVTDADATRLHASTNQMSNDHLPCTVIWNERDVYYDCRLRLHGSERNRTELRVGFNLRFPANQLLLGVLDSCVIDRSGMSEILIRRAITSSGGIPGSEEDLCRVIAPQMAQTGPAMLGRQRITTGEYLDSAYPNGGDGSLFKYELIYSPTTTVDGNRESLKLPQPDTVTGVNLTSLGTNQEAYRWYWLVSNNEEADDYSALIRFLTAFGRNADAQFFTDTRNQMDVNEWLRCFAIQTLFGVFDAYVSGTQHNLYLYRRITDGRWLFMPHDMDFLFATATNSTMIPNADLAKLVSNPANLRTYWSHIHEICQTNFTSGYLQPWALHYNKFIQDDLTQFMSYVDARRAWALSQLELAVPSSPFAITLNGGNTFTTSNNLIPLTGTAPINVEFIEVNSVRYPITWLTTTSWLLNLPVGTGTNHLTLQAFDRYERALTNLSDSITVVNTSPVPSPVGFVVINEIHYRPADTNSDAGFVEIYNQHPAASFDLSNWRLDGAGFVFPEGSVLLPGGFITTSADTNLYALTYTNSPLPAGQYTAGLLTNGQLLRLTRPLATNVDEIVDAVRYENQMPWPTPANGGGSSLQLIDPTLDNERAGNWSPALPTPGATNSVRSNLTAFPPLWINELLVFNTNGISDNFGQREPWLEIVNAGTNLLSLEGLFLTDNYSDLTKWPFPPGANIAPGEFKVIWIDGDLAQTTGANLHTSFRFTNSSGSIALIRTNSGRMEVLDHANYFGLATNRSLGSTPNAQPFFRQPFFFVTPGASNNAASAPVPIVINEFSADNASPGGLRDPVDGSFQDWIELFNPNTYDVDLSGYFLTDTLAQPNKWQIPGNTIIPGSGFKLVWADNQTNQNGIAPFFDLHANFALSAGGEAIGLFASDGTLQSSVVFGAQMQNVSMGLFPEGNTNGGYRFMTNFTPRAVNSVAPIPSAFPIEIRPLTTNVALLTWSAIPGRTYRVEYKAALEDAQWTPLGTDLTTFSNTFTLINTNSTNSQRFFRAQLVR